MFNESNGHSTTNFASANFASANFANVASTRRRVCDAFRVDVVTRQTCERQVWQVFCKFGESGKSGKFGECRLDRFMHIKYVICA